MIRLEDIRNIVRRIKPGEQIVFERYIFIDHVHPPYGFSGPDWVLEGIIGSGYEYSYSYSQWGNVTFYRRYKPLEDGRKTYVSPDRRHLFKENIDGTFSPR